MRTAWTLTKCAVGHWLSDQASTIGAALAFYCAFSLAPLLVILLTIAGWLVGMEVAYGHLETQLTALFGAGTAHSLLMAMKASQSVQGVFATLVSIVTLFVGATTVFSALESALEQIWGVRAMVPSGLRGWVRSRILSFGLVLAFGFLLLISLTLSTGLAALRGFIMQRFSGLVVLVGVLNFVFSIGMATGLIALIYRYMPVKRLPWRQVCWGALITALLFEFGRWLIGLYLGKSTQVSAFGAAASLAALLLWLYYSAQIFLLGAELTVCMAGIREDIKPQVPKHKRRKP